MNRLFTIVAVAALVAAIGDRALASEASTASGDSAAASGKAVETSAASTAVNIDLFGKPADKRRGLPLGQAAPDFRLLDLERRWVKLTELRGRVVLLDFWATWCKPCQAALPHLQRIHSDYGERGLEVLSVNVDISLERVRPFLEENEYSFRVVFADKAMGSAYEVFSLPNSYLIDRHGIVRYHKVGYAVGDEAQLEHHVMDLLALGTGENEDTVAPVNDGIE